MHCGCARLRCDVTCDELLDVAAPGGPKRAITRKEDRSSFAAGFSAARCARVYSSAIRLKDAADQIVALQLECGRGHRDLGSLNGSRTGAETSSLASRVFDVGVSILNHLLSMSILALSSSLQGGRLHSNRESLKKVYRTGRKACLRLYFATLRPRTTPATLEKW